VKFSLQQTCPSSAARAGLIETDRGAIETPVFMPVGTQGTVKAIEQRELEEIGARIVLANTYHLALRPGAELLRDAGGLHRFMNWHRAILTDSGGYQVFSLSELRRIDPDGVTFQSHIDGSYHRFTPENVIDLQRAIGSDIMMILDECPPAECGYEYAKRSNDLTIEWARRAREHFDATEPLYGRRQYAFGIVQGNVFDDLRSASARALVEMDFDGYAIGGLAVGEPADVMYRITSLTAAMLPDDKPRYLMGVGTPVNIVESVARGVDMFDCVLPTRNGRNAGLFTSDGPISIKKEKYLQDRGPVDQSCGCYTCASFSRAYLCNLFRTKEILGLQLATIHNLAFYLQLARGMRNAILEGCFPAWKSSFLERYTAGLHGTIDG
jgi:queuine tRNA-ribosyltransferase